MGKSKTPSFICEIPLRAGQHEERVLLVRLDCARQVYNACLGEILKRLAKLKPSLEYKAACKLPKGVKGSEEARARTKAFKEADELFGFREYDLHAYARQFSHSWLGEHLDALTVQKVATRAFLAARRYLFGMAGKPRFKGKGQFDSVEGKTNSSGILWRKNTVRWLGLELSPILPAGDKVMEHGLSKPVKFVRLVRRKLNGKDRFHAQLICEGMPYRKPWHKLGKGNTGMDLGPSTIAIVSEDGKTTFFQRFCEELKSIQEKIRCLQRRLDRSRRVSNPGNYNMDGTLKKGASKWIKTNSYSETQAKLAELHRIQAAFRKSLHGRLVNLVLSLGDVFHLEKLSYKAFQRMFGKSVSFRGPATFVALLRRKAANAGAKTNEFATRTTFLSQICLCGQKVKKLPSQRWHVCDCGVGPVQRDIFSAWLANFVNEDRLDAGQAHAAWPGVDALLRAASSGIEPAMGQGNPPNLARGQSWLPANPDAQTDETLIKRRLVESPFLLVGTPGL